MWRNAYFATSLWCLFTVVLGEGVPIALVISLAHFRGGDPASEFIDYMGQATAQLIGFGLVLAVLGDRCIDRQSLKHLAKHATIVIVVMCVGNSIHAIDRQVATHAKPDFAQLIFMSISTLAMILAAIGWKFQDLHESIIEKLHRESGRAGSSAGTS